MNVCFRNYISEKYIYCYFILCHSTNGSVLIAVLWMCVQMTNSIWWYVNSFHCKLWIIKVIFCSSGTHAGQNIYEIVEYEKWPKVVSCDKFMFFSKWYLLSVYRNLKLSVYEILSNINTFFNLKILIQDILSF